MRIIEAIGALIVSGFRPSARGAAKTPANSPGMLFLAGLAFIAGAAFFATLASHEVLCAARARTWQPVRATVLATKVTPKEAAEGANILPAYSFRWHGQDYIGHRILPGFFSQPAGWSADHAPGSIITAFVNPDEPEDSVVYRQTNWILALMLLFAASLLPIGVSMCLRARQMPPVYVLWTQLLLTAVLVAAAAWLLSYAGGLTPFGAVLVAACFLYSVMCALLQHNGIYFECPMPTPKR